MRKVLSREQFYKSKQWRNLRKLVIIKQGGMCNRCDSLIEEIHHIIPIDDYNFNDPKIALNIDNLEGLCHDCHNQETNPLVSIREDVEFNEDGDLVKKTSKNYQKNEQN